MEKALKFLSEQKLLVLASHSGKDVWATNMYAASNSKGEIYFVSPESAKHSMMMKKNPEIAFATAWFDISDHSNRKGIQGLGTCVVVSDVKKIAEGIALMNKSFPDLKKTITLEWVLTNIWKSKMWMIMPSYIKHWDDAMYGEDQFKEFTL